MFSLDFALLKKNEKGIFIDMYLKEVNNPQLLWQICQVWLDGGAREGSTKQLQNPKPQARQRHLSVVSSVFPEQNCPKIPCVKPFPVCP